MGYKWNQDSSFAAIVQSSSKVHTSPASVMSQESSPALKKAVTLADKAELNWAFDNLPPVLQSSEVAYAC